MGNIIAYIIYLVEEMLKVILIYYGVLHFKITKKKWRHRATLLIMLINIVVGIVVFNMEYTVFPLICNIICACLIIDSKLRTKLYAFIPILTGINFMDMVVAILMGWIFKFNPLTEVRKEDINMYLILYLPSFFIIVILTYLGRNRSKDNFYEANVSKVHYIMINLGLFCSQILMSMISYLAYDGNVKKVYVFKNGIIICSIILVCAMIMMIKYIQSLIKIKCIQDEVIDISKRQNRLQRQYYKKVYDKSEDLRKVRHDFKHHICYLEDLLKRDKSKDALEYLYQVLGAIESSSVNLNYSGNEVIDSVISGIISNESNSDIKFTYEGKVSNKLSIEEVDICALIANALENAVEACKKCESDKIIDMKISQYKTDLYIVIRNTYVDYEVDNKGNIVTQKEDKEHHGYGLKSIRDIVKKYKGDLEIYTKQENFIVEITLNVNENRDS